MKEQLLKDEIEIREKMKRRRIIVIKEHKGKCKPIDLHLYGISKVIRK